MKAAASSLTRRTDGNPNEPTANRQHNTQKATNERRERVTYLILELCVCEFRFARNDSCALSTMNPTCAHWELFASASAAASCYLSHHKIIITSNTRTRTQHAQPNKLRTHQTGSGRHESEILLARSQSKKSDVNYDKHACCVQSHTQTHSELKSLLFCFSSLCFVLVVAAADHLIRHMSEQRHKYEERIRSLWQSLFDEKLHRILWRFESTKQIIDTEHELTTRWWRAWWWWRIYLDAKCNQIKGSCLLGSSKRAFKWFDCWLCKKQVRGNVEKLKVDILDSEQSI